ncbi:hypothetical protein [Hymenobacter sp. YC55]|uniref:hypothetical protein n=1 Tax=Hymenobacter sp. YC55 TaxID=3034019 RepID=UPI0023F7CD20|nr:hypothetical protein [Hymenobacter sp. YC55]MDF7810735.1 hypothetical protein [Hymenobacter sp. YC55]
MANITQSTKPVFNLTEQAQCLHREIRMRYAVYPGRVLNSKMSQDEMDREIGTMQAAADSLEKMAKNGLFRDSWNIMAASRSLSSQDLVAQLVQTQNKANGLAEAGELVQAYQEAVKLAGYTLRLAELIKEIHERTSGENHDFSASTTATAVPMPRVPIPAGIAAKDLGPNYASPELRQEILDLLGHPAIDRQEKTKQLLNINRRTTKQAEEAIQRLKYIISEKEGPIEYRKAS